MKQAVIVHSPKYANWIFDPDHPTQGRRFINGFNRIIELAGQGAGDVTVVEPYEAQHSQVELVHSKEYIDEVLGKGLSGEWVGERFDLSKLARLFVQGTLTALFALLKGETLTAIHFAGAKHHAQYDRSSGFCVFNDFAIAATIATQQGKRVAIFDCDAHHGDGTENLLADNPDVLTFSIHEYGIFPNTGLKSDISKQVYNYPLPPQAGDFELEDATDCFIRYAKDFKADMIFVAVGADGLYADPLSHLEYTVEGYTNSMKKIRKAFPDTPILFGGAGGYLPDGGTPTVWAESALALVTP